jgi:hypothetical protein
MTERETPLGKARRIHEAHLRTAWEHNYRDAINDARKGNVQRLIDCLIARKRLEDDDYDLLAGFIRDNFRKPGNQFEELPRKVALLALALKGVGKADIAFEAYLKVQSEAIQHREEQTAHPGSKPIIDETRHKTPRGLIEIAFDTIIREVDEPVDGDAVMNAALTLMRNPKRL